MTSLGTSIVERFRAVKQSVCLKWAPLVVMMEKEVFVIEAVRKLCRKQLVEYHPYVIAVKVLINHGNSFHIIAH